jgi:glycine/D-amino acid oxidase-like deaminating enzyme
MKSIFLAAALLSAPLAAQVGARLPLTVERHIVATFGWGSAEPIGPVFADVGQGYYAKPERAGGLLVGPLTPEPTIASPDDLDERVTDAEVTTLAAKVVARVPSLDVIAPRGGWASLYDVSPDWQPVIGEVAPGVFVDAGTSGHGFKLAPALGLEVARMVMGAPDPGLAAFSPERFATGGALDAGWGQARILG